MNNVQEVQPTRYGLGSIPKHKANFRLFDCDSRSHDIKEYTKRVEAKRTQVEVEGLSIRTE